MILEYKEVIGNCVDCIFNSSAMDCEEKFKCGGNTIFEFGEGKWDGRKEITLQLIERGSLHGRVKEQAQVFVYVAGGLVQEVWMEGVKEKIRFILLDGDTEGGTEECLMRVEGGEFYVAEIATVALDNEESSDNVFREVIRKQAVAFLKKDKETKKKAREKDSIQTMDLSGFDWKNETNLCESCIYEVPTCEAKYILFGTNSKKDNVAACDRYVPK